MDVARVRELCREAQEAEARQDLAAALRAAEAAVAASGSVVHYGRGMALMTLAWVAQRASLAAKVQAACGEAVAIARQLVADDFEHAAVIATQAMRLEMARGRIDAARQLAGELIYWNEEALGSDHLRVHQCRAEIAALGLVDGEPSALALRVD